MLSDFCFNPRTHTGCDTILQHYTRAYWVSIHAPTRGATKIITRDSLLITVSIHAPTRGATYCAPPFSAIVFCFNPRTHTGCDRRLYLGLCIGLRFQSTHPHGVRLIRGIVKMRLQSFNPRTHTGCDKFNPNDMERIFRFQSTHPHGVRPTLAFIASTCNDCFNPRTHTGCDGMVYLMTALLSGFNPRTHTGCDKA